MIAMALSCNPALLIADEPTTALDVTIQAQILELIRGLQRERQMAMMLITHDFGVVAETCQDVAVMYAGRVVETGATQEVFANPKHPYTWSLLRSIPRLDAEQHQPLRSIEGLPPDLTSLPPGCAFHPRCPFSIQRCLEETPALLAVGSSQRAACWVTQRGAELNQLAEGGPGA
jgi:oligopeptide/dipeptide ABC transporter ATP-binding protein